MSPTASLTTAAPLTPMSPKELETLRSMMWLADVGHAPTMAVTMQRLLLNIDELTTHAAQVRRAQWMPISTAPKDEATSFLVRRRGFVIQVSWFEGRLYPDARESCIDWENGITDATHWMPFPLPPSPVKAGGETP